MNSRKHMKQIERKIEREGCTFLGWRRGRQKHPKAELVLPNGKRRTLIVAGTPRNPSHALGNIGQQIRRMMS